MHGHSGAPSPLGATFDGAGVNFAIFSAHATAVDLCLFDAASDAAERVRLPLAGPTDCVWHRYVAGLRPGQLYGYRIAGPWDPPRGHRFNPAKVLLDPYARRLGRSFRWHQSLLGSAGNATPDTPDSIDSGPFAPLASVSGGADARFDWRGDMPPRRPWRDTVIYELHVKGFSALNSALPSSARGTYGGVASEPSIRHLLELGVTAVELMPVHVRSDERRLFERGLTNYWGYNTLAFFVPDERFATGGSPALAGDEFKAMVRALHAAGLEVLLDVVYNHTSEGDEYGPTLSFRGIDNASYYRLDSQNRARYANFAGTGNTLDVDSPPVRQLILDSLRYWVEDMHVDGFRFDLAAVLARHDDGVDPARGLCQAILEDPVLSRVKLIAEPWDATPEGYQVGRFPRGWSEWNDLFRNDVRRFWRGDPGAVPKFATRLAGSSDLYEAAGRSPSASVNMITSHDGFTLADLVAHDDRHNEANGEGNLDGERHNLSWNSGVEGVTTNPEILALRERRRRNLFLTLMMSLGVPMISGGDEMSRTQGGNNNAYCHDSPLTWTPWELDAGGEAFLAFVRSVTSLRRRHPAVKRNQFLEGRSAARADVLWLGPDGLELSATDWADENVRALGILFDGHEDALLLLVNAASTAVEFSLPPAAASNHWTCLVDTADVKHGEIVDACARVSMLPHSALVLSHTPPKRIQPMSGR